MSWILLTLLSTGLFTVVNFIDKYIVEKKVRDYRGMPVYSALVALIFSTSLWVLTGRQTLSFFDGLIIMGTGMLTMFGYSLYFNALAKSHTSNVIVLFQMSPIITLVLSFLILHELISPIQFFGFAVILASVVALSLKKDKQKFQIDQSFYLILIADVFFALSNVLIKFALEANSLVKIITYEGWGLFLGGAILYLLFKNVRRAFHESLKTVGNTVLSVMFLNEIIFVVSKSLGFFALALGPVALVSVLGGTQVFFGLLYGAILTLLAPSIYKEDVTREGLLKKIGLTLVLFLGIWLISQ